MNDRTRRIRGWLLSQPRPHSVRVRAGDDDHVIEVGLMKWSAVATSVDALDPDIIEALDLNGKLVRAIKAEELDDSAEDDESSTPAAKAEKKRDREQVEMLTTFANLLAEAYKHSTTVAFSKMVELFEAVSKRGESMEKSLAATERLLRKTYEQAANEAGDGEPSLLESVISAFAAGKANGGVEQAVASAIGNSAKKSNGKVPQI